MTGSYVAGQSAAYVRRDGRLFCSASIFHKHFRKHFASILANSHGMSNDNSQQTSSGGGNTQTTNRQVSDTTPETANQGAGDDQRTTNTQEPTTGQSAAATQVGVLRAVIASTVNSTLARIDERVGVVLKDSIPQLATEIAAVLGPRQTPPTSTSAAATGVPLVTAHTAPGTNTAANTTTNTGESTIVST